jgi:hypothetical protein
LLKISSEDDLFSYISSRICSDPEYFDFLQFVHFEYLSSGYISDFLSALPDSIDRHLWEAISPRLVPPLNEVGFPLKKAKSVEGIISYLTRKHDVNVHDKGIITITSKSVYSGGDSFDEDFYGLHNIADPTSEASFESTNEPGQWVCWDFHEMLVHPTHYTIRSGWLKSWVVESSLDGDAWTEIDRKTDNRDLKGSPWRASFAVCRSAECRFIRLTQTGKNHKGHDNLGMYTFEVFGTLFE